MATLQDFEAILLNTLSSDNTVRKQAEDLFDQAKQYPDQIVTSLTQLLRQSQRAEVAVALCHVYAHTCAGPWLMCSAISKVACNQCQFIIMATPQRRCSGTVGCCILIVTFASKV